MKVLNKKLIFSIIMAFMLMLSPVCYADNADDPDVEAALDSDLSDEMDENGVSDGGKESNASGFSNDIAKAIGSIGRGFYSMVASGAVSDDGESSITFDDLVFDNYKTTSIDFFREDIDKNSATDMIKQTVTIWYSNFRRIAITCYIIILLYIGIRVLITVSGKQQEKYKEYLMAWVEGVLLLFFFPYILKFTIDINHAFVKMIEQGTLEAVNRKRPAGLAPLTKTPNLMLQQKALSEGSIPQAIVWDILCFEFILVLTTYYKRLFMVGFLIAVFPIVMILYPIDKVNDGRSQSFSIWLKEMMSNVFMQTFHALIYVFVVGVASNAGNNWILAMVAITFLFKGEEILKAILGMGGSATAKNPRENMAKAMATVQAATKLTQGAVNLGSKFVSGVRHNRLAKARGQGLFDSKEKRHAKAEEMFNARTDMFSEDDGPRTAATGTYVPAGGGGGGGTGLTPGSVTGTDDKDADEITEELKDASKNDADKDRLLNGTDRLMDRLGNPDDAKMARALEKRGLTDDGKEAMKKLNGARNQAMKALGALKPANMNRDDYNKEVEKIKKDFQVNVQAAFKFQLPEANARTSAAMFQSMLRKHGGMRDYGFGKNGKRIRGQYKEYDRASIEEKLKKKHAQVSNIADKDNIFQQRFAAGSNAEKRLAGSSDADKAKGIAAAERDARRVFASSEQNIKGVKKKGSQPVLVGKAEKTKDEIKDKLKNTVYGQKQQEEIATAMAMLKTFSESTKLDKTGYEANLEKLKSLKAQLDANGEAGITDRVESDALQFFTAEQISEAVETLKKYNVNGMLDDLAKDGLGKNSKGENLSIGGTVSEIDAVMTDMIDSYGYDQYETGDDAAMGALGTIDKMDDEAKELREKTQRRSQKIQKEAQKKIESKKKEGMKASKKVKDKDGKEVTKQYDIDDLDDISTQDVLNMQNDLIRNVRQMDFGAAYSVAGHDNKPLEDTLKEWSGVILGERETHLEQVGKDVLDRMQAEIDWMNAPKVNGQTFEQFEAEGQMHRQRAGEEFARATAQIHRIGLAAITTGPMAIGLNTGQSALTEYAAGTALGAKLLDGAGVFNRNKQVTLKVKDDFGVVREITLDAYSEVGREADFMKTIDEGKVYDIKDLRYDTKIFSSASGEAYSGASQNSANALLAQIENQLAVFATEEQEKIYEEGDKRREAAARARAGRFGNALGGTRRRRH